MIKEVQMYTVVCDNCGKACNEDSDYSCWNDKETALDQAMEGDWHTDGDKHYCGKCYSIGDNDELIIDESRKGLIERLRMERAEKRKQANQ